MEDGWAAASTWTSKEEKNIAPEGKNNGTRSNIHAAPLKDNTILTTCW